MLQYSLQSADLERYDERLTVVHAADPAPYDTDIVQEICRGYWLVAAAFE